MAPSEMESTLKKSIYSQGASKRNKFFPFRVDPLLEEKKTTLTENSHPKEYFFQLFYNIAKKDLNIKFDKILSKSLTAEQNLILYFFFQ